MNTALRAPREPVGELDRLGDETAELSAHIEAATAQLLDLIREFDARGGWNNGFRSCAAWLSWRVGFAPGAAREHVRVARALGTLPRLAHALARGELSYAKVRELTRVATPASEERLWAVGKAGTADRVRRCAGAEGAGRFARSPTRCGCGRGCCTRGSTFPSREVRTRWCREGGRGRRSRGPGGEPWCSSRVVKRAPTATPAVSQLATRDW